MVNRRAGDDFEGRQASTRRGGHGGSRAGSRGAIWSGAGMRAIFDALDAFALPSDHEIIPKIQPQKSDQVLLACAPSRKAAGLHAAHVAGTRIAESFFLGLRAFPDSQPVTAVTVKL